MTFKELMKYWKSDCKRYCTYGSKPFKVLLFSPGFKYTFWMRLCKYLKLSKYHTFFIPFYVISKMILKHYGYKYGIQIPYSTKVGYGLYMGHFGGIVINGDSIIGDNVNLSHGVTIGYTRTGTPTIGNNVYLGSGAKVIGGISVGNNVAIGANAVVTKDLPDNSVAVGIPAKIISYKGNRR